MGHEISVQVVKRQGGPQYTMTIPRPIAQAIGLEKSDVLTLTLQGKTITLRKKNK